MVAGATLEVVATLGDTPANAGTVAATATVLEVGAAGSATSTRLSGTPAARTSIAMEVVGTKPGPPR